LLGLSFFGKFISDFLRGKSGSITPQGQAKGLAAPQVWLPGKSKAQPAIR
jgi:hypothetical protein